MAQKWLHLRELFTQKEPNELHTHEVLPLGGACRSDFSARRRVVLSHFCGLRLLLSFLFAQLALLAETVSAPPSLREVM
jgi:hypothetical protein